MGSRRTRISAALIAMALLLSSCQMEVGVGAKLRRDGSGIFTLAVAADKEFIDGLAQAPGGAAPAGGFDGFRMFFKGLSSRGWVVKDTRTPQGDEALSGQCSFRDSKDFSRCLSELATSEGGGDSLGLRGTGMTFDLGTKSSLFKRRTFFRGSVNLAGPTQGRSAQLSQQIQSIAGQVFTFDVRVELPGSPRVLEGAGEASVRGNLVTWTPKLGEQLAFRAESDAWNPVPMGAVALPALLLLGLALWFLLRRRPAPTPDGFAPADSVEVTTSEPA